MVESGIVRGDNSDLVVKVLVVEGEGVSFVLKSEVVRDGG